MRHRHKHAHTYMHTHKNTYLALLLIFIPDWCYTNAREATALQDGLLYIKVVPLHYVLRLEN